MSILISQNLTVNTTPGDLANRPLILVENVFQLGTVTASSEVGADNGWLENAVDGMTYDWWEWSALPATLEVTLSTAYPVDMCAIGLHTGVTFVFQYYNGSAWVNLHEAVTTATTAVHAVIFTEITASRFRINVTAADDENILGLVMLGKAIQLPKTFYGGHAPITLNRTTQLVRNRTENGFDAGVYSLRTGAATSIEISNMKPAWIRNNLESLNKQLEIRPFVFAWRPSTFPNDVAYCWLNSPIKAENSGPRDLMSLSFDVQAFVGGGDVVEWPAEYVHAAISFYSYSSGSLESLGVGDWFAGATSNAVVYSDMNSSGRGCTSASGTGFQYFTAWQIIEGTPTRIVFEPMPLTGSAPGVLGCYMSDNGKYMLADHRFGVSKGQRRIDLYVYNETTSEFEYSKDLGASIHCATFCANQDLSYIVVWGDTITVGDVNTDVFNVYSFNEETESLNFITSFQKTGLTSFATWTIACSKGDNGGHWFVHATGTDNRAFWARNGDVFTEIPGALLIPGNDIRLGACSFSHDGEYFFYSTQSSGFGLLRKVDGEYISWSSNIDFSDYPLAGSMTGSGFLLNGDLVLGTNLGGAGGTTRMTRRHAKQSDNTFTSGELLLSNNCGKVSTTVPLP